MTPDTSTTGKAAAAAKAKANVNIDLLDREDRSVQFVRVTWVDFVNFVRYRIVPIAHFRKLFPAADPADPNTSSHRSSSSSQRSAARSDDNTTTSQEEVINLEGVLYNARPGITLTKAAFGLVYLSVTEGFSPVGEYVYTPDLTSARLLRFAPGHANVFGWFEEKQVKAGDVKEGAAPSGDVFQVPLCPRTVLRRIVEDALTTEGISFLVGFETEVIFLSSIDPIKAVNDYGWSESPAICTGTPEALALEEIANVLNEAGIELQMYHAEAAPGQFEIVTGPLPPLQACDALITTREIIMNVASKHGLRATLAPRVYSNSCGSAAHAHISLTSSSPFWSSSPPKSVPVTAPPSVVLSSLQQSFLSGLLSHLPAATAFTLPTRASYARMVDGVWSGGTWVSWGRDNREAPIRLAGRGPFGSGYNFEVKSIDGTANPYLAISALLSAGLIGVKSRSGLTASGLHVPADTLSDVQREEYGVRKRMPLNLDEARKALVEDEALKDALGEKLVETYLSVNKTLDEQLKASTPQEEMIRLIKTY